MISVRRATVWTGSILVAVAFAAVGASKLVGTPQIRWAERFSHWGYPPYAHYVVGVLEVLAAVGIVIPRWRHAAALILAGVMTGAVGTHIWNAEFGRVIPPLILGGLALLIYWSDRWIRRAPPQCEGRNVRPTSMTR